MKDNKGQISAEFLILFGVLILIAMISVIFIAHENELNTAMSAARSGAIEGVGISSAAFYSDDTYYEYSSSKDSLMHAYSGEIINVSYNDMGWDRNYDKNKIQFKVYARASGDYTKKELDSIGDRINYYLRKSLAVSFNSTSSTNKLYNPVFSSHYVFTTANIKWV